MQVTRVREKQLSTIVVRNESLPLKKRKTTPLTQHRLPTVNFRVLRKNHKLSKSFRRIKN
jgi:hypothetical protein